MFCPKCGRMNPDEEEFCKGCGAVLHDPEEESAKLKKKNHAKTKLVALIAALVLAVGGICAACVSCDNETVNTAAYAVTHA